MRPDRAHQCSYLIPLDVFAPESDIMALASYLSALSLAGCEVIVVDTAPPAALDARRRILRWVSHYVPAQEVHVLPGGSVDVLQAAVDLASNEKIIVAGMESRYAPDDVRSVCEALDRCEAVTPSEFIHPLPWWGGIDAGRMLLQRGLDQPDGEARTFAFRKSAWRPLLGFEPDQRDHHLRRIVTQGADVQMARELFVRREPSRLSAWARLHAREAATDAAIPFHAALFAGILPVLTMLLFLGGSGLAGTYAGMIAAASVIIAARGRSGAGAVFPLRACLFAPLWIVARAFSVYWGLFARVRMPRQSERDDRRVPHVESGPPGHMRV